MTLDDTLPLAELFLLGALETVINQAISAHQDELNNSAFGGSTLKGKVIRIRTHSPHYTFFIQINADSVKVMEDYLGNVDIRVRGSVGSLSYQLLKSSFDVSDSDANIMGDPALVSELHATMVKFNLWTTAKLWLQNQVNFEDLLGLLRRNDPAWVERFQDLPQQLNEALQEIKRQGETQEKIWQELRQLKQSLRAERRTDIICTTVSMTALLAALGTASGHLPLMNISSLSPSLSLQILIFTSIGLTIMATRFFNRNYS